MTRELLLFMMLCGAFFLDEDHTMGWMEHGVVILLSAYGDGRIWLHAQSRRDIYSVQLTLLFS